MLFDSFNQPLYSDISVVVGEEQRSYFTHKVVLAQCPYFAKCLEGSWKENEERTIYKANISPTTFEMIMEYLYKNEYVPEEAIDELSLEEKLDLLEACEELQIGLQHDVESQVPVTLDNVYVIWNRMFCYGSLTELHQQCIDVMTMEYKKTRLLGRFSELTETAMDALLSHDSLWMNEKLIAQLLRQWCNEDQTVIDRLKHCVRSEAVSVCLGQLFKPRVPPSTEISWRHCITYFESLLDVMNLKDIRLEQRMAHLHVQHNKTFTASSFVDAWNKIDRHAILVFRTMQEKIVIFHITDIWKEKELDSDGRTFYHFSTNGGHEIGVATSETEISKYSRSVGQTMNSTGHLCRLISYSVVASATGVRNSTSTGECHIEITESRRNVQFPLNTTTITEPIWAFWMFQYQHIDD